MQGMNRRLVIFLLALLIGLAISYPAIERIDFWDHFPQQGDETELSVLGTLSLVGLGVIIGLLMPLVGGYFVARIVQPEQLRFVCDSFAPTLLLAANPPATPLRI